MVNAFGATRKVPLVIFLMVSMATHFRVCAQEGDIYLDQQQPVEARIADLLPRLTLEEKVSLIHANSSLSTAGVPRLNIPDLKMDDGPLGVAEEVGESFRVLNHADDFATAMPATIGLAATWNTNLAFAYGAVIGQEAKKRGKNIMLGPGVNIQRTALCGRNFEYMGEDPYLTSRMAVHYIEGEQAQGVSSCVKHFAANNQEYERDFIDENVAERALHEIYFPAFRAAVKEAHVMAVMGAYQQLNGRYCCQDRQLLTDVLKDHWGFAGVAISDWGAVHATDAAALGGLDIEMCSRPPYEDFHLARPFLEELRAGKIAMAVLDEKVRRHLRIMFQLGLIQASSATKTAVQAATDEPLSTKEHQAVARRVAEESIVLLKNKGILPISIARLKTVAVIGGNSVATFCYDGGSAKIKTPFEVTALAGIRKFINGRAQIIYARGYCPPDGSNSVPVNASELTAEAMAAAKSADVVIYVGGLNRKVGFDHEGYDRADLRLPGGQDDLLRKIVNANHKTVVVLMGGGPVEMDRAWLSRVPAVLYGWYPGMEGGDALARVLFGEVNPSGKLPCTFPEKLADTPASVLGSYPGTNGSVVYKEGLLVGYRWYDTKAIEPLFPFGFGLSYTHFKYSTLNLVADNVTTNPATVNFELSNIGACAGAEVAQVYVQPINPPVFRPVKELKGFKKVFLLPGEKRSVSVVLDRSAFAYYDEGRRMWVAAKGDYKILVGSSSRDIRLAGTIHLPETKDFPD